MSATRIDGKAFAARLRERVGEAALGFAAKAGRKPGLAVELVGEAAASQVYVRNKGRRTLEAGMESFEHRLPATTSEAELLPLVPRLNEDPAVHGILVQLPLPAHVDADKVLDAIAPEKDVAGYHVSNVGRLHAGLPGMVPCTPLGCLLLLRDLHGSLSGMEAVVLGRSNIVGKPMGALLLRESCTVTIAHSRTRDLAETCRRADILVAAVGRPRMIPGDWIKPGATVIDVGINRVPAPERGEGKTRLTGDAHCAGVLENAAHATPVPGGVGPMTIALLMANTLTAACRTAGADVHVF